MANYYHVGNQARKMVLPASLAAIVIGGPMLGMMGFTFLASTTLLLLCSPLLLLCSPLLLLVAFLFVATLAGFAVAAAMALAALSIFRWITREARLRFCGFNNLKGKSPDYWTQNFASTTA